MHAWWRMRKYLPVKLSIIAFALLNACGNLPIEEAHLGRSSLKLANGSTISSDLYDDYNPVVVKLSNGYLALVFGSTRTCSVSCSNHNIFIATSVSAHTAGSALPAFNDPQPITANASPLNAATAFQLAVAASGNNITVYAQLNGGLISTTGSINPVAAAPINVGAMLNSIAEYNCYSHRMLGLDAAGLMVAANTGGTLVFRFNPNLIGGGSCGSIANVNLASGRHVSLLSATASGIADSFYVSDAAGSLRLASATSSGRKITDLADSLAREGLISTNVSVMTTAQASGDLLFFSAATGVGQKSDLYVATSPTPGALWQRYVPYGSQP